MQVTESITRKSASNLALAFVLLPKAKRSGMSALYAFCREVDDIADEESSPITQRRARLNLWREDIHRACAGIAPQIRVNQELQPVIKKHHLRFELFDELLRGVEMDLDTNRYATFADLEVYCYRVASVVGLLSIEIFGYQDIACREYAVHLGKALQLTNILRDVHNDAARGRIYFPLSELERFAVREDEIIEGHYSERFFALAQSLAERARDFYRQARAALPAIDRRAMATAELMASVYWRILGKLELQRFNVFTAETAKLSKSQKALLILRTWWQLWTGTSVPSYGSR
ncbi:MAG: presqualene diphosphate synthase HpnD [Verrucomicrobiales bacterium]|nr:presqualene diphosphate synthase HpnD [Verrucomicrobiales bacterium]